MTHLDTYTEAHLNAWLKRMYDEDRRESTKTAILELVDSDEALLNDHSWSELARMANVY